MIMKINSWQKISLILVVRVIWSLSLIVLFLLSSGNATAGPLAERLANFPQWQKIKSMSPAVGDLIYPDWMEGDWQVKSILMDLVAPLAPKIVTPGFEGNRQYLNQATDFQVRFVQEKKLLSSSKITPHRDIPFSFAFYRLGTEGEKQQGRRGEEIAGDILHRFGSSESKVVADRAFNSLNLARAYLNDNAVLSVKVDPDSPNRQITFLRGDRQLVTNVTGRSTETTSDGKFIATEAFQQLFKGGGRPYFNFVESTTAYQQLQTSSPEVEADQVTAVYLSPQDPDYFAAGSRPVALYRYRLEFFPLHFSSDSVKSRQSVK